MAEDGGTVGVLIMGRDAAPKRIFIEPDPLMRRPAVNHRANAPVAQRQSLVLACGALAVPEDLRSVVFHNISLLNRGWKCFLARPKDRMPIFHLVDLIGNRR